MSQPNNRKVTVKRLTSLKNRLLRDSKHWSGCKLFIEDLLTKGYARESAGPLAEEKSWYIPHHEVYNPSKPKIRVTFDCSSKYNEWSLSSELMSGPCSIRFKVLNMLENYISEQLADLFNLSFTTGTFRTLLKTAKVIPIHKKDFKSNFTHYRPISLLSNLDKILEKLMHSRLSTFLNIKDTIYPLQFGFCQNYSTSYPLIHLTETIKEALDQGKYGCGIFVDLQKAFDTVFVKYRKFLLTIKSYEF